MAAVATVPPDDDVDWTSVLSISIISLLISIGLLFLFRRAQRLIPRGISFPLQQRRFQGLPLDEDEGSHGPFWRPRPRYNMHVDADELSGEETDEDAVTIDMDNAGPVINGGYRDDDSVHSDAPAIRHPTKPRDTEEDADAMDADTARRAFTVDDYEGDSGDEDTSAIHQHPPSTLAR